MDIWKDLPNVSGILLTLIGTAMFFLSETGEWLKERKGTRRTIAIVFVILGVSGIVAGHVDRKQTERAQVLAEARESQLESDVKSARQDLSDTRQMLLDSRLEQARMRGQLDALGVVAGKIGQNTSSDMKQLVAAIGRVADTGKIGTLTSKQLCDRAHDLAKRLREFAPRYYGTDTTVIMNEWAAAKTQDEKVAVLNKYRQADERRDQGAELEFRANYTAEAIYLRDEIGKKLPSVPQPSNMMEGVIFKGMSGGSWGTLGAADYLDRLALTLCPR